MIHELKVHPDVWMPLWNGVKTFEFRKNDRGFKVGDTLRLQLIDRKTEKVVSGPLNEVFRRVVYVIEGPAFGIPEGYCIMSIK